MMGASQIVLNIWKKNLLLAGAALAGAFLAGAFFTGASSSDDESDELELSLATGFFTTFFVAFTTGFLATSSSEDESRKRQ